LTAFVLIATAALLAIPLLAQLVWMLAGCADRLFDLEAWRASMSRLDPAARASLARWVLAIAGGIAASALLISAGLSIRSYEKRDL
jgi:hypothetical protein